MPHNEHIHIVYVKRIQCAAEESPVSLKKKKKKGGSPQSSGVRGSGK